MTSSLIRSTPTPTPPQCSATGTGPISYQWLKNDRELSGETQAILSIAEVTFGTLGTYTCRVANAAGVVVTHNCVVELSQSPPMIEEGPASRIEARAVCAYMCTWLAR